MNRSAAARIAATVGWEVARERHLVACARGGAAVVQAYGRSHMLRLAQRRAGLQVREHGAGAGAAHRRARARAVRVRQDG